MTAADFIKSDHFTTMLTALHHREEELVKNMKLDNDAAFWQPRLDACREAKKSAYAIYGAVNAGQVS